MNSKPHYLIFPFCLACWAALLVAMLAHAQDVQADRVSVRLSNPSHPASVKASLKSGGITVKGYDGKEIVVEAQFRSRESQISQIGATRLKVEEENNVV